MGMCLNGAGPKDTNQKEGLSLKTSLLTHRKRSLRVPLRETHPQKAGFPMGFLLLSPLFASVSLSQLRLRRVGTRPAQGFPPNGPERCHRLASRLGLVLAGGGSRQLEVQGLGGFGRLAGRTKTSPGIIVRIVTIVMIV